MQTNSIHQFEVQDLEGQRVSLSDYDGKVLLIVNTASKCGFTPQYQGLQKLYEKYKDRGLEILAFPSNDFGGQEPLDGGEIQEFCSLEFRTTFPVFDKISVVGQEAHPLYHFLSNRNENGNLQGKPRWNFHKYLVNKQGELVDYFYSFTKPTSRKVMRKIEQLLDED